MQISTQSSRNFQDPFRGGALSFYTTAINDVVDQVAAQGVMELTNEIKRRGVRFNGRHVVAPELADQVAQLLCTRLRCTTDLDYCHEGLLKAVVSGLLAIGRERSAREVSLDSLLVAKGTKQAVTCLDQLHATYAGHEVGSGNSARAGSETKKLPGDVLLKLESFLDRFAANDAAQVSDEVRNSLLTLTERFRADSRVAALRLRTLSANFGSAKSLHHQSAWLTLVQAEVAYLDRNRVTIPESASNGVVDGLASAYGRLRYEDPSAAVHEQRLRIVNLLPQLKTQHAAGTIERIFRSLGRIPTELSVMPKKEGAARAGTHTDKRTKRRAKLHRRLLENLRTEKLSGAAEELMEACVDAFVQLDHEPGLAMAIATQMNRSTGIQAARALTHLNPDFGLKALKQVAASVSKPRTAAQCLDVLLQEGVAENFLLHLARFAAPAMRSSTRDYIATLPNGAEILIALESEAKSATQNQISAIRALGRNGSRQAVEYLLNLAEVSSKRATRVALASALAGSATSFAPALIKEGHAIELRYRGSRWASQVRLRTLANAFKLCWARRQQGLNAAQTDGPLPWKPDLISQAAANRIFGFSAAQKSIAGFERVLKEARLVIRETSSGEAALTRKAQIMRAANQATSAVVAVLMEQDVPFIEAANQFKPEIALGPNEAEQGLRAIARNASWRRLPAVLTAVLWWAALNQNAQRAPEASRGAEAEV